MTSWADDVATGQWNMADDQYATPLKLKWRVRTVCATRAQASETVCKVHGKRMEDVSTGLPRLWQATLSIRAAVIR